MSPFTPSDAAPLNVTDPDRIRRVRDVFDREEFHQKRVLELLDEPETVASTAIAKNDLPRLLRRSAGGSPLETLVRLFVLGAHEPRDTVQKAIAPATTAEWTDLGLLREVNGGIGAPFRLLPTPEVIVIQESPWNRPPLDQQVMPVSGSSLALAWAMIQRPVAAAVDVGTGCGILALLAAPHTREVVGTDCNPRAINMGVFNAHFNRAPNVAFLEGNLFEPVAERTFDYIAINPPFVISPEKGAVYRDSGLPSDGISSSLVRAAPRYLRPGGFAQVLINWAQTTGENWRDRLQGWLAGSGCDAFLLRFQILAPDKYASAWLPKDLGDQDAHTRRFEHWLAYYDKERIEAIGYGLITLRRRSAPGPTWFADEDAPAQVGRWGDSILGYFAQRDFLIANPTADSLLASRFRTHAFLRSDQLMRPGPRGWEVEAGHIRFCQGLAFSMKVDNLGMAVLGRMSGERTLKEVLTELAEKMKKSPVDLIQGALPFVRCLIEQGYIEPVAALGKSEGEGKAGGQLP